MAMRATQQNTKAANLMGINVRRVITVTFFISGVYAAIAGFLISGYYLMAYPSMGVVVGNKAFAAAVLGRYRQPSRLGNWRPDRWAWQRRMLPLCSAVVTAMLSRS